MVKFWLRLICVSLCFFATSTQAFTQRYLSDLDSLLFIKDTVRPILKRFDNIRITGYIQPQFQVADTAGAKSYNGGDFSQFSKSRFMLRRARIKIDYLLTTKDRFPKALFSFQFDATERGVNVRDMFLRLYETRRHNFAFTTGIFARPFGYEVNLSSAFRETPERGRMSQILMPSERDLGAMISFEPMSKTHQLKWLKADAGIFNGQGLSGTTDFDSHKDFISRVSIKPLHIKKTEISGGLSFLKGGWRQATKYVYETATAPNGDKFYAVDSAADNIGKIAPRQYMGADIQYKIKHKWGESELRAEYWAGQQPGTSATTSNPGTLPSSPTYRRHFNGAFLLFLQNIINKHHQLMVKYDWYDPNKNVKGADIGKAGANLNAADVKYSTLGIGYSFQFNDNTRLILYYDNVRNELTQLAGYTKDLKDNIFTCRLHFRF